ncbi:MAG: hypothetical protein ACI3T9_02405 [Romboutsia timonensis]
MSVTTKKIYATSTYPNHTDLSLKENFYCEYGIATFITGYMEFIIDVEKTYTIKSISAMLYHATSLDGTYLDYAYCQINGNEYTTTSYDKFTKKQYTTIEINKKCSDKTLKYSMFPYFQETYYFYSYDSEKPPYIEIDIYEPAASDFIVVGSSIDSNIECTWISEDVTSWKVEVIQNGIVKSTKAGTTEEIATFNIGDITSTGETTFKLTVYYDETFKEYTQNVSLTGTQVKISSIEPNSIPQKLYNPIDIKVIGENMTNVVIECVQNGVTKYSDTISNNLLDTVTSTVLANTFTSGTVTLKVTATYQGTYYSNTTTQTVTFTAYGPPKTPVLDAQSEYATPSPLISWILDSEQIEYEVTLNGVIVKDVYSSKINSYQCVDLSNNTYNTIKVRIKNSYNEWSDYAISTFLVSFAELEQPLIHAYSDVQNTCITIVFSSVEQNQFLKHAIYRKKSTETTWQKIKDNLSRESKYSDYCCGSGINYDYKVRALSSIGTFRDSEIVQASVIFSNRVLSVPGEDIFIELTGFETINDSLADIAFNSNSSYLGICGLTVPKRVSSTQKYKSFSCKCCFETQEAYENFLALEEKEILLYRDGKGEAFYCTIQITGTTDSLEYYKYISFVVTETYYSGVEYDKPIYFGYSKREW